MWKEAMVERFSGTAPELPWGDCRNPRKCLCIVCLQAELCTLVLHRRSMSANCWTDDFWYPHVIHFSCRGYTNYIFCVIPSTVRDHSASNFGKWYDITKQSFKQTHLAISAKAMRPTPPTQLSCKFDAAALGFSSSLRHCVVPKTSKLVTSSRAINNAALAVSFAAISILWLLASRFRIYVFAVVFTVSVAILRLLFQAFV